MAKKISSASIDKIIKAYKQEDKVIELHIGDTNIDVVIKPYISYNERCQAINNIVNDCYDENGNYHPEFFDIAFKIAIIEFFTNINTNTNDSVNQIYHLCETTSIIDLIKDATSGRIVGILDDAQSVIKWRNEQSLKSNAWDDVAYMVSGILDTLGTKIADMPEIKKDELPKLVKTVSKLENISEDKIIDGIFKYYNENK